MKERENQLGLMDLQGEGILHSVMSVGGALVNGEKVGPGLSTGSSWSNNTLVINQQGFWFLKNVHIIIWDEENDNATKSNKIAA